jgi:hypothetical protein
MICYYDIGAPDRGIAVNLKIGIAILPDVEVLITINPAELTTAVAVVPPGFMSVYVAEKTC